MAISSGSFGSADRLELISGLAEAMGVTEHIDPFMRYAVAYNAICLLQTTMKK